jgi:hypothetical protein
LSTDPKFIDAYVGDFNLRGDSPALGVDWGPGFVFLLSDVEGKVWPQNGKVDLGAYEETIFVDGFQLY